MNAPRVSLIKVADALNLPGGGKRPPVYRHPNLENPRLHEVLEWRKMVLDLVESVASPFLLEGMLDSPDSLVRQTRKKVWPVMFVIDGAKHGPGWVLHTGITKNNATRTHFDAVIDGEGNELDITEVDVLVRESEWDKQGNETLYVPRPPSVYRRAETIEERITQEVWTRAVCMVKLMLAQNPNLLKHRPHDHGWIHSLSVETWEAGNRFPMMNIFRLYQVLQSIGLVPVWMKELIEPLYQLDESTWVCDWSNLHKPYGLVFPNQKGMHWGAGSKQRTKKHAKLSVLQLFPYAE